MYDFSIVGSGLAAQVLRQVLTYNTNYKIAVVKRKTHVTNFDSTYEPHIVLNHASIRRLKSIGVDISASIGQVLDSYQLQDSHQIIKQICRDELSLPFLGYNIPISKLSYALSKPSHCENVDEYDFDDITSARAASDFFELGLDDRMIKSRFSILCDGKSTKLKELLNIPPIKNINSTQAALSITLSYRKLDETSTAIQLISGNYLLGIIPQRLNKVSVVITSDKEKLTNLLSLSEKDFDTFLRSKLPMDFRDFIHLFRNKQIRILDIYRMDKSLYNTFSFWGLSAKGLHPAGAMGLNNIIYEAFLFRHYINQNSLQDSQSLKRLNEIVNKNFDSINYKIGLLINRNIRKFLSYLPIKYFSAKPLSQVIG